VRGFWSGGKGGSVGAREVFTGEEEGIWITGVGGVYV